MSASGYASEARPPKSGDGTPPALDPVTKTSVASGKASTM